MIIIGIAASFAGANFIAPYFTKGMIAWKAVMVKAGIATLTQRFAISVAANGGDFGKAMGDFLSINTVKALAFNIASAGVCNFLCDKLGVNPLDPTGKIAPTFMGVFK
jgi:hypothetical protein